jgi:hypothetical protein
MYLVQTGDQESLGDPLRKKLSEWRFNALCLDDNSWVVPSYSQAKPVANAAPLAPPFRFENKRVRIDWRLLHGLDLNTLVRDPHDTMDLWQTCVLHHATRVCMAPPHSMVRLTLLDSLDRSVMLI